MCPIILQEFHILDVVGMIFSGCANAVIETKRRSYGFSRGTLPLSMFIALIAVVHRSCLFLKQIVMFPLLISSRCAPQDKEVRRVPLRGFTTGIGKIMQGNTLRLIIIFQYVIISLHSVAAPQFYMLALKLDGTLHLWTGILAGNIIGSTSHLTYRGR